MNAAAPQLVSWNLTRRCNLACGHCYLDATQRKSEAPGELTNTEALDVIHQIAATAPGAMLVLTGGEPLLRKDLAELVAAASAAQLVAVIGTNGVLLNAERARQLRSAGAAGVGISVDSASPEFHDRLRGRPGAWATALDGVRAARDAGLAVQIQATLFPGNRGELGAFADLARKLDALALNFFFLVCTGRGVTQTDMPEAMYEQTLAAIVELQRQRPQMMIRARCAPYVRRLLGLRAGEARDGYEGWSSACLAGRSYVRITPQGRVTPCPYTPEITGDLRVTPFSRIWSESAILRNLRSVLPGGKCGACDYRYSCGGCRARAYAESGNLFGEDPKCAYIPPTGTLPEALPSGCRAETGISWDASAQAVLDRIPKFVRERIRTKIEETARTAGVAVVTANFMHANRPENLAGLRPGRPQRL